MQPAPPLTPGDRVPDFLASDPKGVQRQFYQEVTGIPALLVFLDWRDVAAREKLSRLCALANQISADGVQLFVLTTAGPAEMSALALADSAVRILSAAPMPLMQRLAKDVSGASFASAAYLLDPNQRVLKICHDPQDADIGALQGTASDWRGRQEPAQILSGGAPVLLLPDVLDPVLRSKLIECWRRDNHEGGFSTGQENRYDTSKKKTLEHYIADPALNGEISLALARRVGPELVKVFNYPFGFRFDGHIVMRYGPERQDFFGLHRDNLRQQNKRRFALSLNLNDEFEGGELRFPEYSPHGFRMRAGMACVFSCALLHEARPVTQGERFVLTSFFCDPDEPDSSIPPERRRQMTV